MANTSLFQTIAGKLLPRTNARNEAGGAAYSLTAKQALAQYAMTGALNSTFYANAETQLDKTLKFAAEVSAEFVAKTAVYCRERGHMKDMPALLAATLAKRDGALLTRIFDRVVDDGKMLRNFVQIVRSGVTGRKSLGSAPKRLVQNWFATRSDEQVFRASVGQSPSLADVVKMVHPRPKTPERAALYAWLVGREHDAGALPAVVRQFEDFKLKQGPSVPDVPFQMLTALPLGKAEWTEIARVAPWQMTRMNLNTFLRHGVFDDKDVTRMIAARLRDPEKVRRSRCFPYQLLAAYRNAEKGIPTVVTNALQDALEIATENVPRFSGKVWVFPDISGSMHSAITGERKGSTSKVRCIDIAALIAATVLRRADDAEVLPFESKAVPVRLNGRDTIMSNAEKLAALPAGGTNCSAPLAELNRQKAKGDLCIYVSDNESWMGSPNYGRFNGAPATETMRQWSVFKQRNPRARLVCLDIQPYATTQANERDEFLNIGGFGDSVWEIIAAFANGELSPAHWVGEIEKIAL
jgi:60 kDa SS-A/Ro ribonucleoprotein